MPLLDRDEICVLERQGFLLKCGFLDARGVDALRSHVTALQASGAFAGAGERSLLGSDQALTSLALSDAMLGLARQVLGQEARPLRLILFEKQLATNWAVPWHQDVAIAVRGDVDPPGFGPRTTKDGIPHRVPPAQVLEAMLTVRLHLDDCGEAQGPLLVAPGTHRKGRLRESDYTAAELDKAAHACVVAAGDAVLMRPLLLHASRKATQPGGRRVVHVEYAAALLPQGLEWHFAL